MTHGWFGVRRAWCSSTPSQLMSGCIGGASPSDAVEFEHPDSVAPKDLVLVLVVEAVEHLLAVLLRVRPSGVGVRIVGLEADVVLTDLVERLHAVTVPREAAEDAVVVVRRRRLRAQTLGVLPRVVLLPHGVGS